MTESRQILSTNPELEPRAGQLYVQLRELIIRGHLGPGVRLSEGETSQRFGVSRTPTRAALARLHAEGFLEPHGSRTRTQLAVAALNESQMHDLYDIVGTLEGSAARTVALMPTRERRQVAATMDAWTERFAETVVKSPRDFDLLFETHGKFHETLVDSCHRQHLQNMVSTVRSLVDRYEYAYAPLVGTDHKTTVAEHRAITTALRKGDPDAAEHHARANYLNSATRLAPAIRHTMARRLTLESTT